ncbi:unnamed protein product [Sympodiomycopsis kandeliae]
MYNSSLDDEENALYDATSVINLPAYDTKEREVLSYRLQELDVTLAIRQSSTTGSTSSSVWLSSQVLVAYLLQQGNYDKSSSVVVELGAGTGFLSLTMACTGQYRRVISTDLADVVDTLLSENINSDHNRRLVHPGTQLSVYALDWSVPHLPHDLLSSSEDLLVVATDTIYAPHLILPFWTTFKSLLQHGSSSRGLIAIEQRDPMLIDQAWQVAKSAPLHLSLNRIPDEIVTECVERSLRWDNKDIWDGVELWTVQTST